SVCPAPLVLCQRSRVVIEDCAVLGPFWCGVSVTDGSDVRITRTLVAGLWSVGVTCADKAGVDKPSRLSLADSDVRNCHHRCVVIGCDGCTIDRCRISGSAWHGVWYGGSPTITRSWIFGNARSGIYATGATHAAVRDNVFWNNEMSGVSCWGKNADQIE